MQLFEKMEEFISLDNLRNIGFKILILTMVVITYISCSKDDSKIENDTPFVENKLVEIPKRPGPRPETTLDVPHLQLGVELVPEVNKELIRRVYSISEINDLPSMVSQWQSLSLADGVSVLRPEALIEGREFGHIHDDGSLHIFLSPSRSQEAVDSCWAVFHPYALREQEEGTQAKPGEQPKSWQGFVMLYTPQSIEELNVIFQLIVDGYNNVTGENIIASDFY